ncbi:hypothetical protein [Dictyobacter aurantiacus]|uniref:Replication initiation factor n=1 Tax=Dictyobacter aurantiacus TaxID=1936993 RepID=A0A401ZFX9_9CHLR|nr:hypothetical protein [Dictyobacter aurantiacus]GCE05598.1 hypothetical protein KDAU_29270 [Dictyobacter aurantiacus]
MCKRSFESPGVVLEGGSVPPSLPFLSSSDALFEKIKLVGYGVDTLVLNVRYADEHYQPVQRELDETLQQELDYLQGEAKAAETSVISDWAFLNVPLFVEPHGAGRQWRWLLTCRLLSLTISRGTFNNVIAQVRFSSEYLWSQAWAGDALVKMHEFLIGIFGEHIHLQVSSVDLCADMVGHDFSLANYEQDFVTRARKQSVVYGPDMVNLDGRIPSYLRFSSSGSPISCRIYNKTLEIEQKSQKTWMYDIWKRGDVPGPYGGVWDGVTPVWRHEFHLTRSFLHNLTGPIEGAYDLLNQFQSLWKYAVGTSSSGDDEHVDGWLRYVMPTEDSHRERWPTHPAWVVLQSAFSETIDLGLGAVVRQRIREKNIERGLAAIMGYCSTQAAWLGGEHAAPGADISLTLQWLYDHGQEYLEEKGRDFLAEVRRKQQLYGSEGIEQEGGL